MCKLILWRTVLTSTLPAAYVARVMPKLSLISPKNQSYVRWVIFFLDINVQRSWNAELVLNLRFTVCCFSIKPSNQISFTVSIMCSCNVWILEISWKHRLLLVVHTPLPENNIHWLIQVILIWSVTLTDFVVEKKGKGSSTPSKGKTVLGQAVVDLLPLLQGTASSS